MKGTFKKLVTRLSRGQGGFTLIEMIVVVGIIAVLAAVIVPNIGKFIGSGEQGALDAEKEAVQTAMNAMMAERSITTVTPQSSAGSESSIQDWSAQPAAVSSTGETALAAYLQLTSGSNTVYFYCWGTDGLITQQDKASTACP